MCITGMRLEWRKPGGPRGGKAGGILTVCEENFLVTGMKKVGPIT